MNIRWIAVLFVFFHACASVPKHQQNQASIECRFQECIGGNSTCRDIFNRHPSGHAVDVDEANDKPICSMGTYFDYERNIVVGHQNNVVGSLHSNLLKNTKIEGACVFSPLGAYYFTEGKWNPLPELFRRVIYMEGLGNQNCVIHFSRPEEKKPPDFFLKLGGFWIGDRKTIVFEQYGKATTTKKFDDGYIAYVFVFDKEKQAYLAVETFPGLDNFIWSIQISGKETIPLQGLLGVNIGSSENELHSIMGAPTKRQPITDISGELLTYQGRNYTFEVNEKKVRSIKITIPESFIRFIKR